MCVPLTGVSEKLEMFVAEIEQLAAKTDGIGCCSCAVPRVVAVVLAARIVEDSKQPNDLFDRSASGGDEQAIAFNATPVGGAVNRMKVALKFSRHMLPDAAPL
jgi:hypothetical protein